MNLYPNFELLPTNGLSAHSFPIPNGFFSFLMRELYEIAYFGNCDRIQYIVGISTKNTKFQRYFKYLVLAGYIARVRLELYKKDHHGMSHNDLCFPSFRAVMTIERTYIVQVQIDWRSSSLFIRIFLLSVLQIEECPLPFNLLC